VTFVASADAYISSTTNANNGTTTTLRVKPTFPTETAYLKFSVAGLTGSVQSATLRVYANSGLAWGFDAYTTTSTWTETGLTYQNAPAPAATKLGSFPSGTATGWVSLDVTPAVTANGTYSFALVGTYWQEISLATRETGAKAPQLVVTTSGTPDTQAPSAPANLATTAKTTSAMTLNWTASTDDTAVTGYSVYRDGAKLATTTSASYSYAGLACGTAYLLGVEAYDAAGNTSSRSTLSATTSACPDTQAPTVPANVVQTGSTTTSVTFGWDAATDNVGVTGYGTYLGATSKGTTAATSTTISGLACGTAYTVGVDAADAAANRSAKATISATTAACPIDTQAPSAPGNLAAANVTGNSIDLKWSASTDDTAVTGYALYRDGIKVGTATSTSFGFTGLACGTSYVLGAEASDAAGNTSARSTIATSTAACPDTQPPTVPGNLVQTGGTASSVSFGWDAATDDVAVTSYGYYIGSASKGTTATTSATIAGLTCGTTYTIRVDAADAAGNRSGPATLSASTTACPIDTQAPTAPSNLVVTNTTAASLTLSWSPSTDDTAVTGYTLYRDAGQAGASGSTSYTYTGLACGTTYLLGVEALDAVGHASVRSSITASTAPCGPTSTTFVASADAYVSGSTNANNGTTTTLRVKPSNPVETAYVKFNVTGLTGAVQSATLRVYANSGLAWGFDAYTTPSTWTETGLTYQNAPARAATKLGSFPSGTATGWTTVPVTAAVTANGTYSFALVGTYWQEISLATRETGANAPQLIVTTSGAPPPADTQPPTAPTSLTATGTTTANLSWTAATDNTAVTGYSVYRSTSAGFTPAPANRIAQPTSTGYTDTGLAAGTYYYRVTARDAAGNEGPSSAEATATIAPGGGTVTPTPVPAANVAGVTVGPGFVEASARQLLRTSGGAVYVITSDDSPCQTGGSGVIRVWKGTGAQAGNASVPTAFAEQDSGAHPVSAGSGSCVFTAGVTSVLLSPDSRLDAGGTIHLAYIDGRNGTVYYQTFFTGTDTWGPRTAIATGAQTSSGSGWPRGGQVALTLDAGDVPHVMFATSGSANAVRETTKAGGAWTTPVTVATGTNVMHPSLVTSLDGTLHAAWLDNSLAAHATVKYSHQVGGAWSTAEVVSTGDTLVLNNTNDDQGPSIATDPSNRPHVLFMDGTPNGSDDYVRLRYRLNGSWVDNTPPGGAGGPSSPTGALYAHTPQNYVSAAGDDYVFLGHDSVISPGGFQAQPGGPGSNWGPYTRLDPRDQSNTGGGAPGLDGSASIRFDPLRDPNPGIIDLLYYDEDDGTAGYDHHGTLYYKGIVIQNASPPPSSSPSGTPTFTPAFIGSDTDRTSHTFALTGGAPAGSLVVACTSYSVDNEHTVGMTDSKGNTWVQAFHRDQTDKSANIAQDFWYTVVTNPLVPGDSVTMPVNPAILPIGNSLWTEMWTIRNAPTTVDVAAAGQTNFSTTHTSPSVTTTTDGGLLFGCHSSQSISGPWWTPGGSWSELGELSTDNAQIRNVALNYRVPGAAGTFNSNGKTPSSSYSIDSVVAFK